MAGSRLERIGTIFSRVTGLLQSRAMTLEDRPIWYDVYKAFPPLQPPKYDRPASKEKVRDIFYPEDIIRAKFHKRMGRKLVSVNLSDSQAQTPTQKVIERCTKLQNEKQLSLDDAFKTVVESLEHESSVSSLLHQRNRSDNVSSESIVDSFKQVSKKTSDSVSQKIDMKSIFKED